ncbi:Pre-mRNA-splicing factor SPF27 [Microdochium trichocladiopsis]|uniref:Pre-mRNA-splicing factor SPF27 n=1 Tax=Microdochium trichocladiopsis TaxID=1682393 RepID=A0A9P8Y0K6_9PEZI|nr:Pre-mRNA-splicing factor SPF27 [Microdochium trichocladiopsis]KAH7025816.1 Pre-mRNA-splicing factor SPF27 [Microdochium trichocladiopsis]
MSFRTTVHESLPYIDPEPSPEDRAAAQALIDAELASSSTESSSSNTTNTTSSSLLPPLREPSFTPTMLAELDRIATKQPLKAIDLSRYEVDDDDDEDEVDEAANNSKIKDTLQARLGRAYTANTYLTSRTTHLHLLDSYGKNAWLVGNWHLEAELQALERDLADTKREMDLVNLDRRRQQDQVGEELRSLNETWRRGVGKVLETELAADQLRRQVLDARRRQQQD